MEEVVVVAASRFQLALDGLKQNRHCPSASPIDDGSSAWQVASSSLS